MGEFEPAPAQFTSLSERIAALTQAQAANAATPRPVIEAARNAPAHKEPAISSFAGAAATKQRNNEPISVSKVACLPVASSLVPTRPAPPPLPPRAHSPSIASSANGTPSPAPRPPLAQRSSRQRRGSDESLVSIASSLSSISVLSLGESRRRRSGDATRHRGLPPPLSETKLPPLPPSRREVRHGTVATQPGAVLESRRGPETVKSKPQVPTVKTTIPPSLPPRRPASRPPVSAPSTTTSSNGPRPGLPPRSTNGTVPDPRIPRKLPPQRPTNARTPEAQPESPPVPPPAIPLSSRPTDAQIARILPASTRDASHHCLKCRDFSGPDEVAARYPRDKLAKLTPAHVAEMLCGPFPSPTDRARAIFTWLHHNIHYDATAYFSNTVQHATPETTLARGVAVCSGYAGLFAAIATCAGLESVEIAGHGKGINHSDIEPDEDVPAFSAGHAWNAVRLDDGHWKLVDACWGAGHIAGDTRTYHAAFHAAHFTDSNDEFGLAHFPADPRHFFRRDGRVPSWEEYVRGPVGAPRVQVFGDPSADHGIDGYSLAPARKRIDVSHAAAGAMTRFQFAKVCEHWDFERHGRGKAYLMGLSVPGVGGREEFVLLDSFFIREMLI